MSLTNRLACFSKSRFQTLFVRCRASVCVRVSRTAKGSLTSSFEGRKPPRKWKEGASCKTSRAHKEGLEDSTAASVEVHHQFTSARHRRNYVLNNRSKMCGGRVFAMRNRHGHRPLAKKISPSLSGRSHTNFVGKRGAALFCRRRRFCFSFRPPSPPSANYMSSYPLLAHAGDERRRRCRRRRLLRSIQGPRLSPPSVQGFAR